MSVLICQLTSLRSSPPAADGVSSSSRASSGHGAVLELASGGRSEVSNRAGNDGRGGASSGTRGEVSDMVVPAKAAYTARQLDWLDRHSEQIFRLTTTASAPRGAESEA